MNSIILNFDDSVDVNTKFKQLKKQHPEARMAKAKIDLEELEDERLLALAEERLKNDTGERRSWDEVMAEFNITQKEIDEAEADFE
ncbi:MAG: hypothetical protein FWD23_14575 [Oscillospiraceae bacterium]|nr:hypothetical protein [Oscillospiraceae bacterium]